MFLRSLSVHAQEGPYPLNLPGILSLDKMPFSSPVTLFVGENGSGKSTLLEALARTLQLPATGADDTAYDSTLNSIDPLAHALKLTFSRKPSRGFFLRAEDFFGFTKRISRMQSELRRELDRVEEEYADRSTFTRNQAKMAYAASLAELNKRYGIDPDAQSHGESFLSLFRSRIHPGGLYLLDEPEAPLSPISQLSLISLILEREKDSQFIIATHSPMLMAYPGAAIWCFDETPPACRDYDSLENIQLMRDFLNRPDRYINRLRPEND